MEIIIRNKSQLAECAKEFLKLTSGKRLFAFYGPMGAGKTTIIKSICKELGAKDIVTSPTFTLINEHKTDDAKIYHLDLYRLSGLNEVLDLGIEDFVDSPNSVVLIEWADKLNGKKLSKNLIEIEILHEKQGRTFVLRSDSQLYNKLLEDIKDFANTRN